MQNSHSVKSNTRASVAGLNGTAMRAAGTRGTGRPAAPTLSRISLMLAMCGPLLSVAPGVMAAPLQSLHLNTDSTYVWPNDGSSRANQSGDWGRSDAGALSGNGSQVTYSGNPVVHQTATATLNVGATLSGIDGVAVSSTATNTTTQLTLSGGNTIHGSVNGVDQLSVQGHALTTLDGSVGTSAARVGSITIGDSAGVALNGPVFAGNVSFTVPAEVAVNAGLDANTIDFQNQAATIVVANNGTLNGQVSSTGGANGTVVFVGSGSTNGSLGTQAAPIGAVTVGRDLTGIVTVTGDVDANAVQINHASTLAVGGNVGGSVAFSGNGTLTAGGNVGGNVSTAAANTGNLVLNGSGAQTVSGTVGATNALNSVNAAQTAGSSAEFVGAVTANTVTTGLGSATFDSTLTANTANLANGGSSTFNGAVQTNTLNTGAGDAAFTGAVNGNTANLGSGNDSFAGSYNVAQTNLAGNATFSGNSAAATNLSFTDNGSARFDAGLTGNVDFGSQANASVTLGANTTLDGTVTGGNGNGTLNFAGSGSTTGAIGSAAASLNAVNIGTEATGTVAPAGDVYANTVSLQNGSTLDLVSGAILGGDLTTTANNSGTLNLAGNNTVTGNVGANGAALASVNVAGTSNSPTNETRFMGSVDTAQLNIGDSAALVDGSLTGNVGFSGAGTLALTQGMTGNVDMANQAAVVLVNAGQTIDGSVRSTGGANGAVGFITGGAVTGDLGSTDVGGGLQVVGVGLLGTGTLTVGGNVVANTIELATGSGLAVGGAVLDGNVVTTQDGTGALTLEGGTQTVNGTIGAAGASLGTLTAATANTDNSTFNGDVYALNTTLGAGTATFNGGLTTGTATLGSSNSTFNGDVLANTVSLADGSATFNAGLQANATTIGSGSAVFNGATQTNLSFNGAGTATLNAGLTGNVDLANQAATVNVADGQTLDGYVDNSGGNSASGGTLNFLGNGAVTDHVGSAAAPLTALNIGTAGQGTVNAGGSLYAGTTTLANDSTLVLAANRNLTGTVVTTADQTGALTLAGGTQSVNGDVGAAGAALRAVDASAASANTTFNGAVSAGTISAAGGSGATASTTTFNGATTGALNFAGDGNVVLNGAGALTGTANFNGGAGALHIGDGVALTLDATHTQLANAGNATLTFDGDSVVTGVVGADSGSTPNTINAGATGKTVAFANDVSVGAGNLNVSGDGNVSLGGNLQGALAFAGNGTVDVAAGKQISGAVTTATAGNGTLDFAGGTATQADIGTAANPLAALGFNTNGTAASVTLANNVYAGDITLGANTSAALANNIAFGGNLTMSAPGTSLDLGHYTLTGTSAANGTGASSFALGSGTLKTTIAGGTAGSISADTFSNDAGAHVQVTVAGGNNVITQGQQIKLVDAAAGNTGATSLAAGNVSSTSAALSFQAVAGSDTGAQLNAGGGEDLYLVAQRTDYATAAGVTLSPAAVAAAQALSAVAAPGTLAGASADMHTVLGTLDSYNASQLATQVRRLAPIANGALLQSTLASSDAALANVNSRLQALRENAVAGGAQGASANGGVSNDGAGRLYANGQATPYSVWIKGYGYGLSQSGTDGYDGYSATLGGAALGGDVAWQQGGAGLSIGHSNASIDGRGFTDSDNARVRSDRVTGYLTQGFGAAFVESLISYGNDKFDTTRFTALNRTASGSFNGSDFSFKLGTGLQLPVSAQSVFTPIASVEATTVHQDSYNESGADALDLAVDSKSNTRVRLSLGGRFSTAASVGAGVALRPEVHAFVNHDVGNLNTDVTARYVGGGTYFVTPGMHLARTSVDFGAGLSLGFTRNFSLQVEADVEARSNYTSYGGQVVARGQF